MNPLKHNKSVKKLYYKKLDFDRDVQDNIHNLLRPYSFDINTGFFNSQCWLNFNDISVLLYYKGNHTVIKECIEDIAGYEVSRSAFPENPIILIPIVDPIYSFFGGFLSTSFQTKNTMFCDRIDPCKVPGFDPDKDNQQFDHGKLLHYSLRDADLTFNEKYDICKWFFERLSFSILDHQNRFQFVDTNHMCTLSVRLKYAFKEKHKINFEKCEIIDCTRDGMRRFIELCFPKDTDLRLKLFDRCFRRKYTISSEISLCYQKWIRENSAIYSLIKESFANEYKLFDYLQFLSLPYESRVTYVELDNEQI